MNEIENRIAMAKSDRHALDRLLSDYLPFIKKQIVASNLGLDFDDMLSVAMLTFTGCVEQYDTEKGNFIAFASTSIKNRLIDEARKEGRHAGNVISLIKEDGAVIPQVEAISLQQYQVETQRQTLAYEIDALALNLLPFGIAFRELPKLSPRQNRARALCFGAAKLLLENDRMKEQLFVHKKLAQAELAAQLDISPKTLEKHRKYIVTVAVLMSGDYPNIKTFLPQNEEVR